MKIDEDIDLTHKQFSDIIYGIKNKTDLTIVESIISFCESYQLEPEQIVPVISPKLKLDMQIECEELHMIKKSGRIIV